MPQLAETLLDESNRPNVVSDCCQVVADEVSQKRGLTGLAVKAAFKTVKTFSPNIIESVIDILLDDFVEQLDPVYEAYKAADETDLMDYCIAHDSDISNALLGITDKRAERSKHKTLVKAYGKLRPQGEKHVKEAVPSIVKLLEKHGL